MSEYPWRKYDSNAVFRHTENKKWFALVMEVSGDKLGLRTADPVDVINLKEQLRKAQDRHKYMMDGYYRMTPPIMVHTLSRGK